MGAEFPIQNDLPPPDEPPPSQPAPDPASEQPPPNQSAPNLAPEPPPNQPTDIEAEGSDAASEAENLDALDSNVSPLLSGIAQSGLGVLSNVAAGAGLILAASPVAFQDDIGSGLQGAASSIGQDQLGQMLLEGILEETVVAAGLSTGGLAFAIAIGISSGFSIVESTLKKISVEVPTILENYERDLYEYAANSEFVP
jgi:hypothetical protein